MAFIISLVLFLSRSISESSTLCLSISPSLPLSLPSLPPFPLSLFPSSPLLLSVSFPPLTVSVSTRVSACLPSCASQRFCTSASSIGARGLHGLGILYPITLYYIMCMYVCIIYHIYIYTIYISISISLSLYTYIYISLSIYIYNSIIVSPGS